ncbi:MAG: glycosyltransferase, partial [Acidobacteriota bacterium]
LLVTWHEVWGSYWRSFSGRLTWRAFAGLEWLGAQLGDEVNAVSALTAERLQAYRRGGPVAIIPNGLPFDLVVDGAARSPRSAQGSPPAAPLVCAGRLQVDKRVDLLLHAVAELAPRMDGPLLTVIGDGPQRAALEALAERLGIFARVRFLGRLPQAVDVWAALGEAQIAVQPSAREGFGIFPLEAMAAGLPVVYTRAADSAVSELVRDGVEGLAAEGNAESLAAALGALLTDPDRRRRLAENARTRARTYDWSVVGAQFEALIDRMARGAGGS